MKTGLVVLAVLVLCLVAPVAAQTAEVDWAHGTDFTQFRTFTWATGAYPINDADVSLGMANAVQDELAAKGVEFVDPKRKFDVFVTYNIKVNQDVHDTSRQVIVVALRIFDSKNNNVIWRAGGNVAVVDDQNKNRANVRALVAAMFAQYPPE